MFETNMQPQYLELEITETVLMQEVDKTILKLKQLKDQGIHLSIDDFGTGYSSLSYLKQLPINVNKIDRSFIASVSLSTSDSAITKAIIDLGHYFNLSVIAEGVETLQQYEFLRENGCDQIQGYYVSAPLKADEFEFFAEDKKRPCLSCHGRQTRSFFYKLQRGWNLPEYL
ncbi:EAL domain-containing protein [Ammoniphilus sp. YIM 78166]|uniref:EAL domain-containing protein n=1 Tax=Ammoniphilus sp. YIM 78166 TaxID=1644106 RepID=UPI002105D5EB|nr:EAL domain-containing protein [Ammoniphilus sp. YIM 78166]